MQNTIESEAAWIRTAERDFRGRITVYEKLTAKNKQVLPVDALEGFRMGLYSQHAPAPEPKVPEQPAQAKRA